jgi:hypothetical protein
VAERPESAIECARAVSAKADRDCALTDDAFPILLIHDDQAWLCQGDWSRLVDQDEFRAWAAYSGIQLREIEGSDSFLVVLDTNNQMRLFAAVWIYDL